MNKTQTPAWVGITYLIYCVAMLIVTFGWVGYAVFVLGYSGWWFLLAIFISSCGYKPHRWHSVFTGVEVPVARDFSDKK